MERVAALREGYDKGLIGIDRLQGELEEMSNALEGDVHGDVRSTLPQLANQIEMARFTISTTDQRQHVLRLLEQAIRVIRSATPAERR